MTVRDRAVRPPEPRMYIRGFDPLTGASSRKGG
jgi:hypothetical protein